MVENGGKNLPPGASGGAVDEEPARERSDLGLSDLVKRAVSAGREVASRSKDDWVRVATSEIRTWLDRLDLPSELAKALAKMTLEVKAEIRFRPRADGKLEAEASESEVKVKPQTKT